ncbi:MAG: hypothetical protein PHD13_03135 [Methanocellales archaeon]|nr:hypothetical protein [Methanocellales archaeon]MDD5485365.1 hypothetical protein [Methanocellales archaeon]
MSDAKIAMSYNINLHAKSKNITTRTNFSFDDWSGEKYTWKVIGYGGWDGTYKIIMVGHDEYIIWAYVKMEEVSYAEERCDGLIKSLIIRYKEAL